MRNRRFSKWEVFFGSVLVGFGVMFFRLCQYNFSGEGFHRWALDGLFVTAIVGWVALKALKHFGKMKD